jgi:hypothetical protein
MHEGISLLLPQVRAASPEVRDALESVPTDFGGRRQGCRNGGCLATIRNTGLDTNDN